MAFSEDMPEDAALSGYTIYVVGRLHSLAHTRLDRLVAQRGGRLQRRASAKVSLVVLARSATARLQNDGTIELPGDLPEAAELIGETAFRRRLGLLPPAPPSEQGLGAADLERVSGLPRPVLRALALFDLIEPVDDRYAYRDLLVAREVKRLLAGGARLATIVEAEIELRRKRERLENARLTVGSSGQLFHSVGGALAELSGQLTMPFGEAIDVDEAFREAEAAEQDGDLAKAERLYSTLMRIEQSDPVLPFNLGNVLRERGSTAEAKVAWQMAVARDPGFAEAWYNLALASEEEGRTDLAAAQYSRATKARPDYGDAHFNLALVLTRADRFAEALPVLEAFLALPSRPEQVRIAKRAAALCRMKIAEEGSRTG